MLYYKDKLIRFTGVPLTKFSGVWRLHKDKQRIKTKQCAPRVGAHQRETGRKAGFLVITSNV